MNIIGFDFVNGSFSLALLLRSNRREIGWEKKSAAF
jgi:hypothetical protein